MQHKEQGQTEAYSFGGMPTAVRKFGFRTAENCAGFLLPHLQPGMHLLDCGCGPGSITLGLTQAVAPGEVVGIDTDAASIEVAQKQLAEQTISNLRFEVANIYEIPFPNQSFDVVFSHAVLLHVHEPMRAIQEMKRVLKRGGLIAIRNDDLDGLLIAPPDPMLLHAWSLVDKLVNHNGGNARGAKNSRNWLVETGFADVSPSASFEYNGTDEETRWLSESYVTAMRNLEQRLVDLGLVDHQTVERICVAWQTWGSHPGAFFAKAWCEALGRKNEDS